MTTSLEKISTQQQNRPIQTFYKQTKTYLSSFSQGRIVTTIDTSLEKTAKTCDKLVLSTSTIIKNIIEKLPSTEKARTFIVGTSQKSIKKFEDFLNSTIRTLGGKIEEVKEGSEQTIDKLLSILAKTIEVNSLLVKNTVNQVLEYAQTPSALVSNSKTWANKVYIEVSAISIAVRDLLVDSTNQFLRSIGAKFLQTKNKVKVLLTNVNEPQKAINLLKERFVDVKNVTVKRVEQGVLIIMDRQHYLQNLKKLASSLLDILQTISGKADYAIETSSSFTKQLYEKTIKNYKIQKILLSKSITEVSS